MGERELGMNLKVIEVEHYTDNLFWFKTTKSDAWKEKNFQPGEFTMIGMGDEKLTRAYSIANSPQDDYLEFLSIKVQDGPLTSRLQHIKVNDINTGILPIPELKSWFGFNIKYLAQKLNLKKKYIRLQDTEQFLSIVTSLEQLSNLWSKYLENQSKYFKEVSSRLDKSVYGLSDAKNQIKRLLAQWVNGNDQG